VIKTITITISFAAILTACSTAKKSADTGTAATETKENQGHVQKVTAPPANTQKTEVLYDR